MKAILIFVLAGVLTAAARPTVIPTVGQLHSVEYVVVIRPVSLRKTTDKPDDGSFGKRDLKNYVPLETTCRVMAVFKGEKVEETIKIVHFAYADPKPEFNGGLLMNFLFEPVKLATFPTLKDGKVDLSQGSRGYAVESPEYLAFLRRVPDGRYAAATPQYDAATAFRVLTSPLNAQGYSDHPAARMTGEGK